MAPTSVAWLSCNHWTTLADLQEPLKVSYRPLVFYLASEVAAAFKHIMLLAAGFKGHSYGSYTYYTYNLPTESQAAHG